MEVAPLDAFAAASVNEPRSLVAAASGITLDASAWKSWRFGDRSWQTDAWRLYDITGPFRFVANWAGKSVSRCRLYVAELNDAGEVIGEAEDPEIAALANIPFGTGPARTEALKLAGIDLFVGGECYVIGESKGASNGEDAWWVVTGRQIKRQGDKITINRAPTYGGGMLEFRPGVDLIWRIWNPHPNDSMEPDSPSRAAIPDLRMIELLRKVIFASGDSRLIGGGILAIPTGIDLPRGDNDPPGAAGFMALLQRVMSTSLRDRSSAESMAPILIGGDGEQIEKIRHITFWSDFSEQILPLKKDAVETLALGLDVPPEVLTGQGASNHWSAWEISKEAINIHITPICDQLAAGITLAYLDPAIRQRKDQKRYAYKFDTSPLETKANRSADAVVLHDRMLISDETARQAGAWTEAEAPDGEEKLRRHAETWFKIDPTAAMSDPIARALLGFGPASAQAPASEDSGGGEPPAAEPERQGPPEQPVPSQEQPESEPSGDQAALLPLARYAAKRALSVAGGRLVPHGKRDQWPGLHRHELHTLAAPKGIDELRIDKLLAGAWVDVPDALADYDVDPKVIVRMLDEVVRSCLADARPYRDQLIDEAFRVRFPRRRPSCPGR